MITTTVNVNDILDQKYKNLFTLADILINKIIVMQIQIDDDTKKTIAEFDNSDVEALNDNKEYDSFQLSAEENEQLGNQDYDNTYYRITGSTLKELFKLLKSKNDYKGLFIEDTNKIEINSLAEYFGVLGILKNIHTRFIRLPLDEDYYFINANDRTINPDSETPRFVVKGDNSAETLYFKIDRYYDATDLADTTILVLSQIGDNKYASHIQLIDLDSAPGYIIFGWPIGSILTKQAGSLSFAVRFYVVGEGLEYSFGTLPQTLTVRDSLTWLENDTGIIPDHSKPYIKNFKIDGTTVIEKPVFLDSDNNLSPDSNIYYTTDSLLRAKATSNAGTKIKYEWKIDTRKQELITMEPLTDTEKIFIKETVTPNANIPSSPVYYKKIIPSGSTETVRAIQFEKVTLGKFEVNTEYYTLQDRPSNNEEPSVFQPTEPGNYYCIATAENGIGIEKKALGPYRVKGPAVYDFVITGNSNPLSYDNFLIPEEKTIDSVSLTDYIGSVTSSSPYITRATDKGDYIGMPQEQLADGSFEITKVSAIKDETLQNNERRFAVKNTVNNASSIGQSIKKTFYNPVPTTFTATGTYEEDENNRIYKIANITVTFDENTTNPIANSNFFTRTCVWQQKTGLAWADIPGINDSFSIKKSDLNEDGSLASDTYRINIIYTFNNGDIYYQGNEAPKISTTIDLADFSKKENSTP